MNIGWLSQPNDETRVGRVSQLTNEGFLLEYWQDTSDGRWHWKVQNPRRVVLMSGDNIVKDDAVTLVTNAGRMIGVIR